MKECLPHMARPGSAPRERGLGHGHRAVCCLHHEMYTNNSAVHTLPEVCDHKEKTQNFSV